MCVAMVYSSKFSTVRTLHVYTGRYDDAEAQLPATASYLIPADILTVEQLQRCTRRCYFHQSNDANARPIASGHGRAPVIGK